MKKAITKYYIFIILQFTIGKISLFNCTMKGLEAMNSLGALYLQPHQMS